MLCPEAMSWGEASGIWGNALRIWCKILGLGRSFSVFVGPSFSDLAGLALRAQDSPQGQENKVRIQKGPQGPRD